MSADEIYADQAKRLVDDVIEMAIKRLETNLSQMSEKEKTFESLKMNEWSRESTLIKEEDYVVRNIAWLTIGDFTIEKAQEKIDAFIKFHFTKEQRSLAGINLGFKNTNKVLTWEYDSSWLYCIDFMGQDAHQFDTRFRFRVRWSIPTRRKPIPRATACVYFTFQVSKIKPKNYPVEVYYVFETNRLVHRPGESRFREKWLKDIIESKVLMMQTVTF